MSRHRRQIEELEAVERRGRGRPGRLGRLAIALCALPLAGVAVTGCASHGTTASAPPRGRATVTSTKSTTTSTTVPACGSTRDPFDPTDSPAPTGSPAHC